MPRTSPSIDDDSLPVMVPRNDKRLVPVSPERVQSLRQHLIEALSDLRKARRIERLASPTVPEPTGFPAIVARAACSLCRGSCCKYGGDHAFIGDRTLARVRLANPKMTEQAMLNLYLERVPAAAYRDSCIFHGEHGCTLDRSMRADVCNTYFCGGLASYLKSRSDPGPTVVLAGDGKKVRVSPVLTPAT
jgi:hypothetical protein